MIPKFEPKIIKSQSILPKHRTLTQEAKEAGIILRVCTGSTRLQALSCPSPLELEPLLSLDSRSGSWCMELPFTALVHAPHTNLHCSEATMRSMASWPPCSLLDVGRCHAALPGWSLVQAHYGGHHPLVSAPVPLLTVPMLENWVSLLGIS
jgi:hypothetical protein